MSAIGRMTTSPTPKIQARALGPPSARDTRASSTEMLPQVQAVKVARRTPIIARHQRVAATMATPVRSAAMPAS